MARSAKRRGKSGIGKTRTASPSTGRKVSKTKNRIASAAIRGKRHSVSDTSEDLKEAREQQAATAEILKVIASSPDSVQPVFEAIVTSAAKLFEPCSATITILQDNKLYWGASAASISGFDVDRVRTIYPIPFDVNLSPSARAVLERRIIEIPDTDRSDTPAMTQRAAATGGFRSITFVPLIDRKKGIGTIIFTHPEAGFRYSERQLDFIQTFADQAVIAIQNARLFNEVQLRTRDLSEALRQQTAMSDVLRVISGSSGDLGSVFRVMLDKALQICEASYGNMMLATNGGLELAELYNSPPAFADLFKNGPLTPPPATALGRVLATKKAVHVPDLLAEGPAVQQTALRIVTVTNMRARTLLAVPMLKEADLVGVIVIYRQDMRPFSEKQIELVTNFADQAVIAIESARLLNELRMRTGQLSRSLEDLRAAQDRLVQTEKLASLGQLTAGIAHEIKNPLNFVNNFSALCVELTNELKEILTQERLTDKGREETNELTGLLKDNLSKVVHHGNRADSIVKNMLLHSREGSGERRSAEINRLVEESLSLAYHGARAEKAGFSITIKRDLDPEAGALDLYPQEMTRALLNLISNGFYAATKRKAETGDVAFEPVLSALTRHLGEAIEIRIRDNGTGIPPDVKEKMFDPFFTTKPAGEGTGLGLSMTHDIIVKQHGGRIDVDTEPGIFTEFVITLPRHNGTTAGPQLE
ncbi:GAF domain-containing protein [Bradyrhizobium sp. BWC-3-1]|uniref:GAF domain-containing protein n=1 Tax=Bradyrhizobium sp. BWC-3-1 TaxID=3080012 RepID=UPI00293F3DBF|nr:GAF domain-containing protein [Bradyrhizobium sp. BWC-3-1]WOH55145.1 GAF domain-containing protein [Bradyrhizobium sp. BWC-3-1]